MLKRCIAARINYGRDRPSTSRPHAAVVAALFITSLAFALDASGNSALAHVTLEQKQAAVGTAYKAVLRVPHGCGGSPTTAIRVRLPEGVIDAKPMPKSGWTLKVIRGKYAKAMPFIAPRSARA
jgi:uncharacterized protein YcnI